jgi:FkbM family methyltransferase
MIYLYGFSVFRPIRIKLAYLLAFAFHSYPIDKGRRRIIWFMDWLLPDGDYPIFARLSGGGMRIQCIRSDLLSLRIFVFGEDEPCLYTLLLLALRFAGKSSYFIDIGANLGTLSLRLTSYTRCRSICIEPQPSLVKLLNENSLLNGINSLVSVRPYALSDREGEMRLSIDPHHLGGASLRTLQTTQSLLVPVKTLDSVVLKQEWMNAAIVKVDVEGFEKDVFLGAFQLFSSRLVPLVFEINRQALDERNISPKEVVDVLRFAGYTSFHAVEDKLYPPSNGVYNICNILATTEAHHDLLRRYGVDESWAPRPRPFYPVYPLDI